MKFIGDEKKNRDNIKKHKLDFTDALPAFFDPLRKEYYDDRHSSLEEDRFLLAGFAGQCLLLISFTEPEPDVFRIITARKADKYEQEQYYGNG